MPCLSLPRGGTVHPGIRWTLVGINILLIITGIAMVLLGLQPFIDNSFRKPSRPDLWWLGLMPLTIGCVGLITAIIGLPKWLIVWTLFSVLTGAGSYVFFIKSGCFNPKLFGVTMQIYGTCHQKGTTCCCVWSSESLVLSRQHSCAQIRTSTSIYLSQMILMTLSLAATIIGCFLAAVVTCCARCLGLQTEEERSLLKTGNFALKHNRSLVHTRQTTSLLSQPGHTSQTSHIPAPLCCDDI